jgi:hypothetical protein
VLFFLRGKKDNQAAVPYTTAALRWRIVSIADIAHSRHPAPCFQQDLFEIVKKKLWIWLQRGILTERLSR